MKSTPQFDVLIVGSGPSGSHAAMEAAAAGCKVGLVDVGYTDSHFEGLVPNRPFSEIRRSDPNQHKYFLGDDPEATLRSQERAGAHLTPSRLYMIRNMDDLFPLTSDTFLPLQSTGAGGLGISWGANCFAFEDSELERLGILPSEIRPHYDEAAKEAGVSGRVDDALAPFIANLDHGVVQPPLPLDTNSEVLLRRYQAKENQYKEQGFYLGQSMLAMLSRPSGNRQANPQYDMDFWADLGRSVYRPKYTLEKLKVRSNFAYLSGRLATRFREEDGVVTLECKNLQSQAFEAFSARKLMLAAGAINSGRLALASFQDYEQKLPIVCNINHWAAAINLSMLGRPARDERHSLSQLTVLMRTQDVPDYVLAQIYSYRSLFLFRLLKNIPLPPRQGIRLLRLIATAFTCINIHFPDYASRDRWLKLDHKGGEDTLNVFCEFSSREKEWISRSERQMLRFLTRLRCIPIGVNRPMHGASLHYVGTLPYSKEDKPFTTGADGKLRGTSSVYVADGSTWPFLPAKGLTLTLMANARRTAAQAVRELSAEPVSAVSR
jgi:choline dehydrogenase-like flavoprotein